MYRKVKCKDGHPGVEDYYTTDIGKLFWTFPDDTRIGWCTSEARQKSQEYPTWFMEETQPMNAPALSVGKSMRDHWKGYCKNRPGKHPDVPSEDFLYAYNVFSHHPQPSVPSVGEMKLSAANYALNLVGGDKIGSTAYLSHYATFMAAAKAIIALMKGEG